MMQYHVCVMRISRYCFLLSLYQYDHVLFDQRGLTPLMCAADNGHVAAIEVLLTRGANIEAVDNVSNCGCTAYCVND